MGAIKPLNNSQNLNFIVVNEDVDCQFCSSSVIGQIINAHCRPAVCLIFRKLNVSARVRHKASAFIKNLNCKTLTSDNILGFVYEVFCVRAVDTGHWCKAALRPQNAQCCRHKLRMSPHIFSIWGRSPSHKIDIHRHF